MAGQIYILALMSVSLASLFLGAVSWNKSDIQGARWLAALLGSIALWTSMQAASALAATVVEKLFYHNMMYIGISLIPVTVLCFVLDYYHLLKTLSAKVQYTLFIIPLMTATLVATDGYHHLFYRTVNLQDAWGLLLINGTFNMWFWVHSAYSYLLILGTLLILGYQLRNESGPYRRQSLQLTGAIAASSTINILTIIHVIQVPIDLTPFTFILVGAIFYYSLFYTGVFEIGPITKDLLYDTIHDGLLIVDTSGAVTEHNKAFLHLFDTRPEKVIGRNATELFNTYGYPVRDILDLLGTAPRFQAQANHRAKTWQITRSLLKSGSGQVSGTLYLFKDMTEISHRLNAADKALQAAEHARESITRNLSDMSHEIRTPLMGILGAAHQLKADASGDEQASDADEILAGAEDLLGTVNRILDYSKLEAGKMHAVKEAFSLSSYLSELKALTDPTLSEESAIPGMGLLSVIGDRAHCFQLIHLIHSFLQDSGIETIHLVIAYEENRLMHTLRFQKPQPDAEELLNNWTNLSEYLMKPWHPDPLKLVLANRLAQFIDAPLTIVVAEGEWLIRYALPLEAADEPAPQRTELSDIADRPCKLLFAEDSVINQAVIRRMFKTTPWEITFADDGLQALEIARTSIFDGIFTDIHMPGLGGIELSYSLMETPNRDTPIFALTSDTDAELQEMIARSPIRSLVVKPCPKDHLIRLLRENPRIVC